MFFSAACSGMLRTYCQTAVQIRLVGLKLYLVPLSFLAYHLHEHDMYDLAAFWPAKVLLPCCSMPRIMWQFSVTG